MIWNSSNLSIPLGEFARLFGLSGKELRREGVAGRLVALGLEETPGHWTHVGVREDVARAWVVNKRLPPPIRAKVKRAGGLDALDRWRADYFSRVKLDLARDAIILPDGTRIEHPLFRPVTEH